MTEDNKPIEGLTRQELNDQYILAVRNANQWHKKWGDCIRADAKAVCLREFDYWCERRSKLYVELVK